MNQRIYIDFDDVLCETAAALSTLARLHFGVDVPYEQIALFDLRRSFGLSQAQYETLMSYAHEDDFLLNLSPAKGALAGVRTLAGRGDIPVIVTGRPADTRAVSMAWLERHGCGGLQLIHVDKFRRWPEQQGDLSLEEFEQVAFDAAVEDAPLALDLLAAKTSCRVFIFDRPWNRGYTQPRYQRCAGWAELMEQL